MWNLFVFECTHNRFNKKICLKNNHSFFCEPFFTRVKDFSDRGTITRTSNDLSISVFTFSLFHSWQLWWIFEKETTRANLMWKRTRANLMQNFAARFWMQTRKYCTFIKNISEFKFFCYLTLLLPTLFELSYKANLGHFLTQHR